MDPWLERPTICADVHASLIFALRRQLVPQVSPRYAVAIERRVYLLDEDDPARVVYVPDVSVARGDGAARHGSTSGGASAPSAVLVTVTQEPEVRESRLVVMTLPERHVVTAIEVLSPTNKTPGSRGRDEYQAKRRDVLRSDASLVEIDLLRGGQRVVTGEAVPGGDYLAHVSRHTGRPRGEVWVWGLRDSLPRLPVPLRDGDPEAILDLGQALATVYDECDYVHLAEYAVPPVPPLSPSDEAWARDRLRASGLAP
jgi:hypothetical protein